jgi:hypothetical protein
MGNGKRSMFSKMPLKCCICGVDYEASVTAPWQKFTAGVCGEDCFDEKNWRRTLSIMGQTYYPKPVEKKS